MEVKGVTLPAGSSFVVRRPDGNTLPTGASSGLGNTTSVDPTSSLSFRLGVPALPLTGTYTVLITPASNTTGSIQFTLWKDVEGGELALDMPKSVTTVYRQQLARLTFSGTASDSTLGMEVKGVTLPAGSSFVVRRPDGNTLPTGASSGLF